MSPSDRVNQAPRLGVIAAAGEGRRAHPRTAAVPKALLEVAGTSLLERNLVLLRDQLGIREAVVVIGHLGEQIRAAFGDGSRLGLRLRYLVNPVVDRGLGTVLEVLRGEVREPFVLLLGDELYLDSNHAELRLPEGRFRAVCGFLPCEDLARIRRNYTAVVEENRVRELVEKPEAVRAPLLGCGTYLLHPDIFADLEATPRSRRSGRLELTDVLNTAAQRGAVYPFLLRGSYVNVNTLEDLSLANVLARERMLARARTSLVIPASNEADSIGFVIEDFRDQVDEVLVVDNCSADGTAAVAASLGARVISRPLRGYGHALRCGMEEARGDILVLVEADATFRAKDLPKLREYLRDADMVIGTRTTRQMIEQGANMDALLRWGNVAVGKLIEALWWGQEPRFTDVGCTYRALWRDVYHKIRPYLTGDGPALSPEMMIEVLRVHGRVIEVPVSYYRRLGGESKLSASRRAAARNALRMLRLILRKRLNLDR